MTYIYICKNVHAAQEIFRKLDVIDMTRKNAHQEVPERFHETRDSYDIK